MTIPDESLKSIIRQLLSSIVDLQEELAATRAALEAKGLLTTAEVQQIQDQFAQDPSAKAIRARLEKVGVDTILDMLRRFEGPPQ